MEQAENLIKQHEQFLTTMEANDEKINSVNQFGTRLLNDSHYAADKIGQKSDVIKDRYRNAFIWGLCQRIFNSTPNAMWNWRFLHPTYFY